MRVELSEKKLIEVIMVTTNDSRIRFIDLKGGKVMLKLKGHKNEGFVTRSSINGDL